MSATAPSQSLPRGTASGLPRFRLAFHYYHYNTGMGDNCWCWGSETFDTEEEALALMERIKSNPEDEKLGERLLGGDGHFPIAEGLRFELHRVTYERVL